MLKWLDDQRKNARKKRDDPNRNVDLGYWAGKVNAYIEVTDQVDMIIDKLREKHDECKSRWNKYHVYAAYEKMKAYNDAILLLGGDVE